MYINILCVCRFLFPDSPTNAWFLTMEERAVAVARIKVRVFDLVYLMDILSMIII